MEKEAAAQASEEEWKKTLASLKEQALKTHAVSQEAYAIYSERAKAILIETSNLLKEQTDKASQDLNELAKAIGEDGKDYLSVAAENSPVPVKDIVETFTSSTDDLNKISKLRDFYLGIPYGTCNVGEFMNIFDVLVFHYFIFLYYGVWCLNHNPEFLTRLRGWCTVPLF